MGKDNEEGWSFVKKLTAVCGLILSLAAVIGLLWKTDARFEKTAHAESTYKEVTAKVIELEQRVENNIEVDRYWKLFDRLLFLREKYPDERTRPKEIQRQIVEIELELQRIEAKGIIKGGT